jgi:oxygen-independent coproporphyrinogen-3 oxidase
MNAHIPAAELAALIGKYESRAPRYTSYPPIPYWGEVTGGQVAAWLEAPAQGPLSLYTHIPFCRERCTYCGCFVIISPHHKPVNAYLEALHREMERTRERMPGARGVRQYHLGGGTPTYLDRAEMTSLVDKARALFSFDPDVEMSIEVDPRTVDGDALAHLRSLGFNRLSLGVQDFDPAVQEQVNRRQPAALVARLVETGRRLGFLSINFDLIYGLPHQTRKSFAETMEQVVALAPDRLALYNFAHLPHLFPHQRSMDAATLPGPEEKLGIFLDARERMLGAGYLSIGMDHFARQGDDLAVSWNEGTLRRNFMGYTTQAGTDLIGFGVSAISEYQGHYWQNEKKLSRYEKIVLQEGRFPAVRGMELSGDDRLRQTVMMDLFCRGRVEAAEIHDRFGVDFASYFAGALHALGPMAQDGLVEAAPASVRVTERGRLFLRNVAQAFDGYAGTKASAQPMFSRTV